MGAFVVNEIVASETPERSMSLKCVPVKHESNTQASVINEMTASETPQQSMLLKCWPVKHQSNSARTAIHMR